MKKEIRTRTITEEYEVYTTIDGKEFNNYPSARAHEEALEQERAEEILKHKAKLIDGFNFLEMLGGYFDDSDQYLVVLDGSCHMSDMEELFIKALNDGKYNIGFDYYNCPNNSNIGTFVVVFNSDTSWGTWFDIKTLVSAVNERAEFVVKNINEEIANG